MDETEYALRCELLAKCAELDAMTAELQHARRERSMLLGLLQDAETRGPARADTAKKWAHYHATKCDVRQRLQAEGAAVPSWREVKRVTDAAWSQAQRLLPL
jgi:hypothetical protein